MPHSLLAPVSTTRAVVTASKKAFAYQASTVIRPLPFPVSFVKSRLGIDSADTSHDVLIGLLILGAVEFAEKYTGLTFIDLPFKTFRDFFTPSFELRRAPISVINSVKYTDDEGNEQTVPNTVYGLTQTFYQRVFRLPNKSWPQDKANIPDAIQIEFVAGFGPTDQSVPGDIKMALLAHVVHVFTKAGDCCDEGTIPNTALDTYKQRRIISIKIAHAEA